MNREGGEILRISPRRNDINLVAALSGTQLCRMTEESQTARLTLCDTGKIKLACVHEPYELSIKGTEYLERIKQEYGGARLGCSALVSFYQNQEKIPKEWKERDTKGRTRRVTFDGSDLTTREDKSLRLFLFWAGGKWRIGTYSQEEKLTANYVSAVYED